MVKKTKKIIKSSVEQKNTVECHCALTNVFRCDFAHVVSRCYTLLNIHLIRVFLFFSSFEIVLTNLKNKVAIQCENCLIKFVNFFKKTSEYFLRYRYEIISIFFFFFFYRFCRIHC